MKDATKTISIIWGVLATLVAIILIIVASTLTANGGPTVEQLVAGGMTEEEAYAAIAATSAVIFVFAFVSLGAAVYSVILGTLVHMKKINRVVGIVLGALAILIGSLVPGVLFIVDSVRSRDNNGLIEVAEEEKTEESKEETKK